jgi:hypothetical protein
MLGVFLCGYLLGSSDGGRLESEIPRASSSDVYINIPALCRVKEPLAVKIQTSGWHRFYDEGQECWKGELVSYADLFAAARPKDHQNFEVLRITRILSHNKSAASFWFEFIEKDRLAPEEGR